MNVLSRLRQKIRPNKTCRDPFGTAHRTIMYALHLESWDYMPIERRREIIEWCKQNLWKDKLAYFLLRDLKQGKIKAKSSS